MSTPNALSGHTAPLSSADSTTPGTGAAALPRTVVVSFIALVTVLLRIWHMDDPYQTCDMAALPNMVHHFPGWRWVAESGYAPMLPLVVKLWGCLLSGLHLPMGEIADRAPIAMVGVLQVALTYPLLRRMHFSKGCALAATFCCSALPAMVADAHLPWAHPLFWHVAGMVAIWATLSYLDEGRAWMIALAGLALWVHTLSSIWAFAVPLTLIIAWVRHDRSKPAAPRLILHRTALLVLVLIAVLSVTVTLLCWVWTGKGVIGHLLFKESRGTGGMFAGQVLRLPSEWAAQFGYLFAILAAGGLLWGTICPARGDRRRLLAIWGWLGLLPILFLANWNRTEPGFYLIEIGYAAGTLGGAGLYVLYQRMAGRRLLQWAVAAFGLIAFAHMTFGTVDDVLCGGYRVRYTGIQTGWGSVHQETGVKAAGWYVRRHVPVDAIVLLLHTSYGMEIRPSEYYTGRHILAGCNHQRSMHAGLLAAMRNHVDVIVLEARDEHLLNAMPEFERVCTIRRDGKPVRMVYALAEKHLSRVDDDVLTLNDSYDQQCRPRQLPQLLATPPGFAPALDRFVAALTTLKKDHTGHLF